MTAYQETLNFLFGLQRVGIKLGLENIRTLLNAIDNPQLNYPTIHLAGTNGKGSTAAMLTAILRECGYRVAQYTSPHLIDFSERIQLNGQPIPESEVVQFTGQIRPLVEKIQSSFFEVTTAMAFWYFANQQPDIAIIETGLGGRLDATNTLQPLLTLITPIDFDHQIFLGNTIRQIAAEKAGIIKSGVPCLTNNRAPEVLEVLETTCRERGASFSNVLINSNYHIEKYEFQSTICDVKIDNFSLPGLQIALPGEHQVENALLAIAAVRKLPNDWQISENAIRKGLASVRWPGRIHQVSHNPDIVIDVSHNPAGFAKTFSFIKKFYQPEQIHVLTFLQNDKDLQKIADCIALHTKDVRIIDLNAGKPLNPHKFAAAFEQTTAAASIYPDLKTALPGQHYQHNRKELWLIIGSHYLAGEAYKFF